MPRKKHNSDDDFLEQDRELQKMLSKRRRIAAEVSDERELEEMLGLKKKRSPHDLDDELLSDWGSDGAEEDYFDSEM